MAQFQPTFTSPEPSASSVADRVQLIDATGLGGQRLCGTARFARVDADEETDTRFSVVTGYFIGEPGEFTDFALGEPTSIELPSQLGGLVGDPRSPPSTKHGDSALCPARETY